MLRKLGLQGFSTFDMDNLRHGKTGNKKRATCLATLLQKELISNVVHFTTHIQTCLATNQVVNRFERGWKNGAQLRYSTRFATMLQDMLHVFAGRFSVPLGKIRRHHWKERLKVGKNAKFESDMLKTNEEMTPQSREILQTFEWWGGTNLPPHPTMHIHVQTSVNFPTFAEQYLRSLRMFHFQIWQFYEF